MKKLMLCTDLDRTLLPNGAHAESANARQRFRQFVSRDEITLVYVSGRDKGLVKEAIENYAIPCPDYVISDVGSMIYKVSDRMWDCLRSWEQLIQQDWGDTTHIEIQQYLSGIREIRLQEKHKQNRHKVSFYVNLGAEHAGVIQKIEKKLNPLGIQSNIIWSIDDIEDVGLVDILPSSASKKHAMEYLMQQLDFTLDETVFAGDSGNDMSVITSPVRSILVANATRDVKTTAEERVLKNNRSDNLYIARGDFMDMNGNYSAGILEGVVHYFPETQRWLITSDDPPGR